MSIFHKFSDWVNTHYREDEILANLTDMVINIFIMSAIFVWPILRTHTNHFGWPIILELLMLAFNVYRLYEYLLDNEDYVRCFVLSFCMTVAIIFSVALLLFMFVYEL